MKNLRSQQKIYATAGRTGRDKYHVCLPPTLRMNSVTRVFEAFPNVHLVCELCMIQKNIVA